MLESLLTLQDAKGNTFDLTDESFMTINAEWQRGFSDGFARGFLFTTGIVIVASAAAIGAAVGTRKYLQHRHNKQNSTPEKE